MIDRKHLNTLIFEAFMSEHYSLIASRGLFPLDEESGRIFFRFRYGEIDKEHLFYEKLRKLIEEFSGALSWKLCNSKKSTNFLLIPEVLVQYLDDFSSFSWSMIDEEYGGKDMFFSNLKEDVEKLSSEVKQLIDNQDDKKG